MFPRKNESTKERKETVGCGDCRVCGGACPDCRRGVALSVWWACAYIPYRAAVDLTERHQTLRGFGASSAWYWQDMGANASEETAERAVEMLYGDDGLRLNIFRYNIGGGSADAALDWAVPYSNGGFDEFRRAESFSWRRTCPKRNAATPKR